MDDLGALTSQLGDALEAARLELIQRIGAAGYPLSYRRTRTVVRSDPESGSQRSEDVQVESNILLHFRVALAIAHPSTGHDFLAFRSQFGRLADWLASTRLGRSTTDGIYPHLEGAEKVLVKYLSPLAYFYLKSLEHLSRPEPDLVAELAKQLHAAANATARVRERQLAIAGPTVSRRIAYREVAIRPLDEFERGAAVKAGLDWEAEEGPTADSDFIVPRDIKFFWPDSLLTIRREVREGVPPDEDPLLAKVALALFTHGFRFQGGRPLSYDYPQWIHSGYNTGPPIAGDVLSPGSRAIVDEPTFRRIVDFAYAVPDFGASETSRTSIVFQRALTGLSAATPLAGFIDCMIALEGALLPGIRSELSYRFRLNGALFLGDELDPVETHDRLRRIYDVRSDLVHGEPVQPEKRATASAEAAELLAAVVRKAVGAGLPDAGALNRSALGG